MATSHQSTTKNYVFGLLLLTLREKAGLTQAAVAGMINVSEKAVYNWEAGSDYPTGVNLKRLIETYLHRNVFTVGHEQEEVQTIWEQIAFYAPRRKAIFDAEWFRALLQTYQQVQGDMQVAQKKSEPTYNSKSIVNWNNAPDVSFFCGRSQELHTLTRWILQDRCRVVTLLGMGGIGKTTLAATLMHQISNDFQYTLWHSLKNAPPLSELLHDCIAFFSKQQYPQQVHSTENDIEIFLDLFRSHRCLLILDNVETILQPAESDGRYSTGYEGYEQLIESIAESEHQSCLLLTSREKLKITGPLEAPSSKVYSLQIKGLNQQESQELLHKRTLHGNEQAWEIMVQAYAGNPLALKMVSEIIHDLFDGDIAHFLAQDEIYFNSIRQLLDQQVARLSALEQDLLYWLAIERDQVSIETLRGDINQNVYDNRLVEGLHSLYRRSLLERGEQSGYFTLQPVVMEYMIKRLINQASTEIEAGHVNLLSKYAFMQAQAKEYIRNCQLRLIMQPLIERLLTKMGSTQKLAQHLRHVTEIVRAMPRVEHGYSGGNLINILAHVAGDVRHGDFSSLAIKGAYLQDVDAQDMSLAGSSIAKSVFMETFGSITSVAFSPDGLYLAAGSFNSEIRVWRVADMKQIFTFTGHTGWIWSIAFSPDSTLLASGSNDHTIRLWDIRTPEGTCIKTLQGHTHWIKSVAFSPDGTMLASGSNDATIQLWSIPFGQQIAILHGHTDSVSSVVFSPNGITLASGSNDATIQLWNVEHVQAEQNPRTFYGHTGSVSAIAFSSDGTTLASGGDDHAIKLWEASTGRCMETLYGHGGRVATLAFSPDGTTLASGSADHSGKLWDVRTGLCIKTLQGHLGTIYSLSFDPAGKELATGGDDQMIRVWQVTTGDCLRILHGYTGMLLSVIFCQNSRLLISGGEDACVRVWDITTGCCLNTLHGHEGRIWTVACSPQNTITASAGHDRTIRLWDNNSGQCIHILRGHTGIIWSVAFNHDGTLLASGSEDGSVKLWDVRSGDCVQTLYGHKHWVWSVAFNHDGTLLASGSVDHTVKLWDPRTGCYIKTFHGHSKGVSTVAFHPDTTTLMSGSYDQTIKFWKIDTEQCVATLQNTTGAILSMACNREGTLLISGSNDHTMKLWHLDNQDGHVLHKVLSGHDGSVLAVSISPDGILFASSGEDGTIKLWSAAKESLLKTIRVDYPYERMNIWDVTGITSAQTQTLRMLGAVEQHEETRTRI